MPKSREDLAAEARREYRAGITQAAVAGGVLAVCAYTFPTVRLVEPATSFVEWTSQGAWAHPHLLQMPLARALAAAVGAETAWYVLSALGWALALPLVVAALQSLGLPRLRVLAGAGLAFLAPAGMLAATTPGPFGLGLLGAALVLFGLAGGPDRPQPLHARRAALCWVAGCALYAGHALLFPAVVVAVLSRRPSRAEREARGITWGWLAAAPAMLVAAVLLADLLPAKAPPGDFLRATALALVGGPGEFLSRPYAAPLALVPGLGVALVGLLALALPQGKGRRTALWSGLWVAGAILPPALFGMGARSFALPAIGALPVAALGLAFWLGRADPARAASRAALLAAVSVVLLTGFRTVHHRTDPDRNWSSRAAGLLEPDDVFLTRDGHHLYVARQRFGVETLDLREPVELAPRDRDAYWRWLARRVAAAHAAGRRVVLDVGPRGSLAGIRDFPFRKELHRLGLRAPLVQLEQLAAEARYARRHALQRADLFPDEHGDEDAADDGGALGSEPVGETALDPAP